MNFVKKILDVKKHFSNFIPANIYKYVKKNVFIIYYHVVSDENLPYIEYLYSYKNIKAFKEDLDWFLKHFTIVSLHDYFKIVTEKITNKKQYMIFTFDDGLKEIYEIIAPILLEKGIPATFFVSTGFIDNKEICSNLKTSLFLHHIQRLNKKTVNELIREEMGLRKNDINEMRRYFYYQNNRDYVINELAKKIGLDVEEWKMTYSPYVTSDQIRYLIRKNFTIGSHGISHPVYGFLDTDEQIRQTIESTKFIRSTFKLEYGYFSFPHSDLDVKKECFESIFNAGVVDIALGTGGIKKNEDIKNPQRISMEKPPLPAEKIFKINACKSLLLD